MATWAEAAAPIALDYVTPGEGQLVPRFNQESWRQAAVEPGFTLAPAAVAGTWIPYDLALLTRISGYYFVDIWNQDQPGATLSVSVVYPDGQAAPGARVRLYNRDQNPQYLREATTDSAGVCAFASVRGGISGLYYLLAIAPNGAEAYDLGGVDRIAYDRGSVQVVLNNALPLTGLLWPTVST